MDDDEKVDALISKNNGNTEPVGIMCVYSQSCISCIFKDVLQSRIQRRHQCAGRKAATPSILQLASSLAVWSCAGLEQETLSSCPPFCVGQVKHVEGPRRKRGN